jgi:hypothetical protein
MVVTSILLVISLNIVPDIFDQTSYVTRLALVHGFLMSDRRFPPCIIFEDRISEDAAVGGSVTHLLSIVFHTSGRKNV